MAKKPAFLKADDKADKKMSAKQLKADIIDDKKMLKAKVAKKK